MHARCVAQAGVRRRAGEPKGDHACMDVQLRTRWRSAKEKEATGDAKRPDGRGGHCGEANQQAKGAADVQGHSTGTGRPSRAGERAKQYDKILYGIKRGPIWACLDHLE